MRRPILEDLDEESLSIENLTMANLDLLHNTSEGALLQLGKEIAEFETTK